LGGSSSIGVSTINELKPNNFLLDALQLDLAVHTASGKVRHT